MESITQQRRYKLLRVAKKVEGMIDYLKKSHNRHYPLLASGGNFRLAKQATFSLLLCIFGYGALSHWITSFTPDIGCGRKTQADISAIYLYRYCVCRGVITPAFDKVMRGTYYSTALEKHNKRQKRIYQANTLCLQGVDELIYTLSKEIRWKCIEPPMGKLCIFLIFTGGTL
jgi:hypothetical protein